ncbi:MAG: hypothetical protein ABIA74_03680 [bacterium]
MNKKFRSLFLTIIICFSYSFNLCALSNRQIYAYSILTGWVSVFLVNQIESPRKPFQKEKLRKALPAGVFLGLITYYYLNKYYSPNGRLNKVNKLLQELNNDFMLSKKDITEKDLISLISASFYNLSPLVLAKDNLVLLQEKLKKVQEELIKVNLDANGNKKILDDSKVAHDSINDYLNRIIRMVGIIINNSDYNIQLDLYKKNQDMLSQQKLEREEKERDRKAQDARNTQILLEVESGILLACLIAIIITDNPIKDWWNSLASRQE